MRNAEAIKRGREKNSSVAQMDNYPQEREIATKEEDPF